MQTPLPQSLRASEDDHMWVCMGEASIAVDNAELVKMRKKQEGGSSNFLGYWSGTASHTIEGLVIDALLIGYSYRHKRVTENEKIVPQFIEHSCTIPWLRLRLRLPLA